eukprot:2872774-Pleurochrysis_carterae.AAC.1
MASFEQQVGSRRNISNIAARADVISTMSYVFDKFSHTLNIALAAIYRICWMRGSLLASYIAATMRPYPVQ